MDEKFIPERLNPSQAAEFIGCSEYTIKDLARRGEIPYFRVGNRLRYNRSSLQLWIQQQEQKNYTAAS
jgi:DNA binding domain, excisionase family